MHLFLTGATGSVGLEVIHVSNASPACYAAVRNNRRHSAGSSSWLIMICAGQRTQPVRYSNILREICLRPTLLWMLRSSRAWPLRLRTSCIRQHIFVLTQPTMKRMRSMSLVPSG